MKILSDKLSLSCLFSTDPLSFIRLVSNFFHCEFTLFQTLILSLCHKNCEYIFFSVCLSLSLSLFLSFMHNLFLYLYLSHLYTNYFSVSLSLSHTLSILTISLSVSHTLPHILSLPLCLTHSLILSPSHAPIERLCLCHQSCKPLNLHLFAKLLKGGLSLQPQTEISHRRV